MTYDEFEREQEIVDFINNKIKRCRKCGQELHYKEKYYHSDRICCICKGLPSYENDEKSLTPIMDKPQHTFLENNTLNYMCNEKNKVENTRASAQEALFKKYPEWCLLNEIQDKKWKDKQSNELSYSKNNKQKFQNKITNERIFALLEKYDNYQTVDLTQDELISLFWEVLYHRGVNNVS
ncbi:TPA: hypothetical protein N2Z50_002833 [Escherichia coli]|nr:hypothetical protein [Escherichia coli]